MNKYLKNLKLSLYFAQINYKATGNYFLKLDINELEKLIAVTEARYA